MSTLKTRPSISGVNHHALAFAERKASTAKLFTDITDLVKLNDATGQIDEDSLACELQGLFDSLNADKTRDLRLWKDTGGKALGFGQLTCDRNEEIDGYLFFDVHPTRQGDTLETEILQWSEERMREVGQDHTRPVRIQTPVRSDKIARRMLLEKQGFTNERCFLTMACSLERSFSSFSLPEGFTLRSLFDDGRYSQIPGNNLKAWVELFNESFVDHWNHHNLTVAAARYWLSNPHYKRELNLVAVAPDGTLAAFCVGYLNLEENACTGRNEGWIKLLGTGRSFRRLGLGRAILLAAIRQFKALGIEQIKLGVDAQSLTSATQLYQSVGFHPVSTWLTYVKENELLRPAIAEVGVSRPSSRLSFSSASSPLVAAYFRKR
jgi:mycothiol synthase